MTYANANARHVPEGRAMAPIAKAKAHIPLGSTPAVMVVGVDDRQASCSFADIDRLHVLADDWK